MGNETHDLNARLAEEAAAAKADIAEKITAAADMAEEAKANVAAKAEAAKADIADKLDDAKADVAADIAEKADETAAKAEAAKERVEARIAEDNAVSDRKIAFPFRVFGALCILLGICLIPIDVGLIQGIINIVVSKDWSTFNQVTVENQGIVLNGIAAALYAIETALFAFFGIRLVMNKRRGAARLSQVLICVTIADILLTIMIHGFGTNVIYSGIVLIFLVIMNITLDPALREERILQRKLKALEDKADQEDGTLGRDKTGEGFLKLDFFNIFWLFIIGCIAGLIFESLVCPFLNGRIENRSGLLWGPFSPIYGFGAVMMVIALNRFYDKNPLIIFVVSGIIGGAFEFFVSWFFQFSFGISAWDYSGEPFNIDGRTDLFHMVCWGFLGWFFIKGIVPQVLKLMNLIPWNWRYGLTAVCTALMIFNGAMTMLSFECWYSRVAGNPVTTPIEKFMEQNFDNDFMKGHFATMSIDPNRATRS